MIQSNRSYANYEELGSIFEVAKVFVDEGNYEPATKALERLYAQAVVMWGPAPQLTSDVGGLWRDVREGNVNPPAGDFSKRIEELREGFRVEYNGDVRRAMALKRDFLPAGKPSPPSFLARRFTDDQLGAMLRAIHEREGEWGRLDADAEIVNIGQSVGLAEEESYKLLEHLVKEGYVDPGRNLRVPGSPDVKVQTVGFGVVNVTVTEGMRLLERGRAAIDL